MNRSYDQGGTYYIAHDPASVLTVTLPADRAQYVLLSRTPGGTYAIVESGPMTSRCFIPQSGRTFRSAPRPFKVGCTHPVMPWWRRAGGFVHCEGFSFPEYERTDGLRFDARALADASPGERSSAVLKRFDALHPFAQRPHPRELRTYYTNTRGKPPRGVRLAVLRQIWRRETRP